MSIQKEFNFVFVIDLGNVHKFTENDGASCCGHYSVCEKRF